MKITRLAVVPLLLIGVSRPALQAAAPKVHTVTLGPVRRVPYLPPEATPDTRSEDAITLRIRPLYVDDRQKEWTVGEIHEVTDRSFVVRRALHINDALPGETARWAWQPGPWLQVDRLTGHVLALHLPSYDPDLSTVVWFRDYAAYCGVATAGKGGLVAVVAELGTRKAVVQKVVGPWPMANPPHPVCAAPRWQRTPMRVTFDLTVGESITLDVLGTSSFIEEGENGEE